MAAKKAAFDAKSLLAFWEDPDNHKLIVNAKPSKFSFTALDCKKKGLNQDSKPRSSEAASLADKVSLVPTSGGSGDSSKEVLKKESSPNQDSKPRSSEDASLADQLKKVFLEPSSGGSGDSSDESPSSGGPGAPSSSEPVDSSDESPASGGPSDSSDEFLVSGGPGDSLDESLASGGPGDSSDESLASGGPGDSSDESLASGGPGDSSDEDSEGVVEVDDAELTMFPACCVGKLFWLDQDLNIVRYCSAFHIGGKKIMTVAHVFYDSHRTFKGGIFVPAMINKYDIYGKNFGYYVTGWGNECAGYHHDILDDKGRTLWTPWLDVAIAPLVEVKQLRDRANYLPSEEGLESLKELKRNNEKEYNDQFQVVINPMLYSNPMNRIPRTRYPLGHRVTVYGYTDSKMKKITATLCLRNQLFELLGPGSQLLELWVPFLHCLMCINATVLEGMSGGPWIVKCPLFHSVAVGIQSGTFEPPDQLSFSPNFFTQSKLIDETIDETY